MARTADPDAAEVAMWEQLQEEDEIERQQEHTILYGCRDLAELRSRLELANLFYYHCPPTHEFIHYQPNRKWGYQNEYKS